MTDPIIEQQISDALNTVLPDSVYPVLLPQGPTYPAISYHRKDYRRAGGSDSRNPLAIQSADGEQSEFQIVIYDRVYTDAARLLRQVKTELETIGLTLESVADGYEFEQNVFSIITEWSVWGDLAENNTLPLGDWDSLKPFVSGVLSCLSDQFDADTATIRFQSPTEHKLMTPALVLDIESMATGTDPGDGMTALELSPVIHCCLPVAAPDSLIRVRSLAADVIRAIAYQSFTPDCDLPSDISATAADTWPGRYGFHRWAVNWRQQIIIGQSIWPDDCNVPTNPRYSWKPAIGTDHEPDYQPLINTGPCEDNAA